MALINRIAFNDNLNLPGSETFQNKKLIQSELTRNEERERFEADTYFIPPSSNIPNIFLNEQI